MRGRLELIAIGGIAFLGCTVSCSDMSSPQAQIERCRYLVERVAMCGDCHTTMTASLTERIGCKAANSISSHAIRSRIGPMLRPP
ncbi:hypothetical protein PYK22_01267 [Pyrinomonas methylaliphatogenes]|uniref:Uncharacterized protein n=1 Tax=Pyrinomonas methylaliphatogenes TaxID=454194 RepID=A0A0B6WY86_9BACT|nr:hypothetical protein PYK22_01267 [Pyrinomonas methylaliphatogenes]